MHFRTLGIIYIPEVADDPVMDAKVAQDLAQLEAKADDSIGSIFMNIRIRQLRNLGTEFSRQVAYQTDALMEPYYQNCENPKYLVFEDYTAEVKQEFEESVDCIRRPDGRIFEANGYRHCEGLTIKNGEVYSRRAGPLKHTKKTRKSRKYKAMLVYPRKKIYKDLADYAVNYLGYVFNEEKQAYGYLCNPNGMWDWYVIGGRWPRTFLVKEDCKEYAVGEHDYGCDGTANVPKGYRWVSAARKKDIQWDVMRQWTTEQLTKQFYAMESAFALGQELPDRWYSLRADGYYSLDGCAYLAGDTLEAHLAKHDIPKEWQYPVSFCDIVTPDGWEGEYQEFKKTNSLDGVKELLRRITDETIDDCDDDDVLVSIDYHS